MFSYLTIIYQLNIIKQERSMLTNFCNHSYKGQEMFLKDEKQAGLPDILSRHRPEPEYPEVTYSNSSESTEKRICETLRSEITAEVRKSVDRFRTNLNDNIDETKLCASWKGAGKNNNKMRRFSDFDAFQKVLITLDVL
jgi:hypothetical protein